MRLDAVDLRDFYNTGLGQVAARMIGRRIQAIWPDTRGLDVLGLGYATPFLEPLREGAARILAAMPATQGVLRWPSEEACLTALTDEAELPFPDLSFDRVLLVHVLETTEQVRTMMREIWRVLGGGGRLLVIVPNRSGLWARLERTPFGHGQPYSAGQLSRLLRDSMFTPVQSQAALFFPPTRFRMVLAAASACEEVGQRGFGTFAGVVMIEATKQIYAGHTAGERVAGRRRSYVPLPHGPHRV